MKLLTFSRTFIFLVLWIGIAFSIVYAAVNYAEYFPNWSTVYQSQQNWWTNPVPIPYWWYNRKEIVTPDGICRITSTTSTLTFVPTRTLEEWTAYKNHLPAGITLDYCTPLTYSWQSAMWPCSASCGPWVQYGSAWCQRSDGEKVSQTYCSWWQPAVSQGCNVTSCDWCTVNLWSPDSYLCTDAYYWNWCPYPEVSPAPYKRAIVHTEAECGASNYYQVYNAAVFQYYHYTPTYVNPWTPVNGYCGSANGWTFSTTPTTNLCSAGTASLVTLSWSSWLWSCYGASSGSNVNCNANK